MIPYTYITQIYVNTNDDPDPFALPSSSIQLDASSHPLPSPDSHPSTENPPTHQGQSVSPSINTSWPSFIYYTTLFVLGQLSLTIRWLLRRLIHWVTNKFEKVYVVDKGKDTVQCCVASACQACCVCVPCVTLRSNIRSRTYPILFCFPVDSEGNSKYFNYYYILEYINSHALVRRVQCLSWTTYLDNSIWILILYL
jgi:hypothetical protein